MIAGDSRVTGGDIVRGESIKVFNDPTGGVLGVAGHVGLADDTKPDLSKNSISAIHVTPQGRIIVLDERLVCQPLEASFCAIGSGNEIALGAMAADASAVEAVKLACRYDVFSGEPVTTRYLNGHSPEGEN